ncbi:hypothetical protein K474DRAFT_1183135 [Panus rudis PR-1116 ss-1]|nr:hypothetical protein K474DRAFT_1183135 [Panus rudis PR-1116 ss-1]
MYPRLLSFGLGLLCAVLLLPWVDANSYFIVNNPRQGDQWVNGNANHVSWTKGLLDGVDGVDVELSRLSQDGLIFVARDGPRPRSYSKSKIAITNLLRLRRRRSTQIVPASSQSLNIYIQDVPPADDYYLIFLNSTHGILYGHSPRFSILPTGSSSNTSSTSPDSNAPTVTISGAPDPLKDFATTFPPNSNSASGAGWEVFVEGMAGVGWGLGAVVGCMVGGGALVLM